MMPAIPGGAARAPFVTHHDPLYIDLYLRIAPGAVSERLTVEIRSLYESTAISERGFPPHSAQSRIQMLEFLRILQ